MRHLSKASRRALVGTMRGVVMADGGPTNEQRALLEAISTHLFGVRSDSVEPLSPEEAASALGDPADRRLAVESVVLMELVHHPPSEAVLAATQGYLDALGEADGVSDLIRDQVRGAQEQAAADLARLRGPSAVEPAIADASSEGLRRRLDSLRDCAPGTLGRGFVDFYDRNGFAWPIGNASLVHHDFDHVLAGYVATPEGELALQAMLAAADDRHFSGLLASLLLFEAGLLPFGDIAPTEAALARPGATDLFAEALVRGARCGTDFSAVDHFAAADRDLAELRAELGIDPPPPGPFTLDS
jgi:ubiquinone biosynthesis protein Coq4